MLIFAQAILTIFAGLAAMNGRYAVSVLMLGLAIILNGVMLAHIHDHLTGEYDDEDDDADHINYNGKPIHYGRSDMVGHSLVFKKHDGTYVDDEGNTADTLDELMDLKMAKHIKQVEKDQKEVHNGKSESN